MRFRLTLCFLFWAKLLHGQSFTVYNYSIPEGLPSAEVYEVFEDSKGFLWFGTDNGIVRFDGHDMQTFHTKDGLSDPVVFSFFEDFKQRLWFRTFSGKTSYFYDGKLHGYPYNDKFSQLQQGSLIRFVISKENELVFTGYNMMGKIDSAGNVTKTNLTATGLHHYIIDGNDLMAYRSDHDPIEHIYINEQKFDINLSQKININLTFSTRWKNDLYLSIHHDLFRYDGVKVERVLTSANPITNVSVDNKDNLWVGYLNDGARRYSKKDFKSFWSPEFLQTKSVTKVMQDHEGGFWFSTLESGVFHVPNLSIENFPIPTASRLKAVTQSKTEILMGDQRGNLYSMDKVNQKITRSKSFGLPIISMYYTNTNQLLLSNNKELFLLDSDLNVVRKYRSMVNDYSYTKSNIWTYGASRLRIFDRNMEEVFDEALTVPYRFIHAEDSLLYIANRIGLHIRDMRDNSIIAPRALSKLKISDIKSFNDSTILITTFGNGFLLWNKNNSTFKIFNTETNFFADNIYCSLIHNQDLWLSTEKGLIKIASEKLIQDSLEIQYITKRSGLVSDRIDFLEVVDNSLWAFSDKAYSTIPLPTEKFSNTSPIFYLRSFKVNDSTHSTSMPIEMTHDLNNIEVNFGYISYNNPHVFLRYRVNARSPWVFSTNKKLLFSSLSPGVYGLELQHSTDKIHWTASLPPISFTILSPWWNRWYTYLLSFLAVGILGYFYFRYQQSIYRQKNKFLEIINSHQQRLIQSEIVALERERNRISKELHDRVGTNLTAIKLTVNQLLEKHNQESASEVEQQFQIAIQEIKDIIYGLTPPSLERYGLFTGLKNYISKLQRNIPIKIAIKTFGKEVDDYELNIIVFRIIQELITNSIKHSFAKEITIHLSSFEDVLNILYEDNGVGFSYDPVQSGLGLDNIESRIQSLNGSVKFESGEFGISYAIDIPLVKKEAS